MGLFHPVEWPNFLATTLRRPWRWPGHAGEVAALAVRRVRGSIQQRRSAGTHQGAKQRPPFIDAGPLPPVALGETWRLPRYPAPTPTPPWETPFAAGETGDPETRFARHRWRECVAALGSDASGVDDALRHVAHWILNQPPRADAAWEPYSASERVVNLAVLLAVRSPSLDDRTRRALSEFLSDSIAWIDARLEYYGPDRTNNHILNNGRALIVGGTVLGSAPAVTRGLQICVHMGAVLFGRDGMLRERSSHYQVVVTQWLLDAEHFASIAVLDDPTRALLRDLSALVARAAGATGWMIRALRGGHIHVGDISPDVPPSWSLARLRQLYPHVLSRAAAGTRQDDWLRIDVGAQSLVACVPNAVQPDAFTTHGHQDLGGFVWFVDDEPILVDAGRTSYVDDAATRRQIGPEGHNSLRVNGLAPLVVSVLRTGRWCPSPYSDGRVDVVAGDRGFVISHNGFTRIVGVGLHTRRLELADGMLTVEDAIDGTGTTVVEVFWQLTPGAERGTGDTQARLPLHTLDITTTGSAGAQPSAQWVPVTCAHAYGRDTAALMLRHVWTVSLPCTLRTAFSLTPR